MFCIKIKNNFILKGGMLLASYVGLDTRSTMDIDATVRSLPLTLEEATKAVNEIIAIPLDDNVSFKIKSTSNIMEEHEYPGLRFMLDSNLDKLRQTIKIDISTGDVVTPDAIEYAFPLMFENRQIPLMAYNIETILAEKMETIISRAEANTRMRDYYDIHILMVSKFNAIDISDLKNAFKETCIKRSTGNEVNNAKEILDSVMNNSIMEKQWSVYQQSNYYVGDVSWNMVINSCQKLAELIEIY